MDGSDGARRGFRPTTRHCATRSCSRSGCACAIWCNRAEHFVEFYARLLPRQVSSAAALEHLTRHLSESQRQALMLTPEQIFARAPECERLEQFPKSVAVGDAVDPGGLSLCAGRGGRRRHVARAAARAADADASRGGCGDSGTRRAARERVAALLAEGGAAQSDSHWRGGAGVSRRGSSTGRCAGGALLDHACARRAGEPGAVRSHAGAAASRAPRPRDIPRSRAECRHRPRRAAPAICARGATRAR